MAAASLIALFSRSCWARISAIDLLVSIEDEEVGAGMWRTDCICGSVFDGTTTFGVETLRGCCFGGIGDVPDTVCRMVIVVLGTGLETGDTGGGPGSAITSLRLAFGAFATFCHGDPANWVGKAASANVRGVFGVLCSIRDCSCCCCCSFLRSFCEGLAAFTVSVLFVLIDWVRLEVCDAEA